MMNAVVVFGAIHFLTQWFEHLATTPVTVIGGGILAVGIAFGLRRYDQKARVPAPATGQSTGTV